MSTSRKQLFTNLLGLQVKSRNVGSSTTISPHFHRRRSALRGYQGSNGSFCFSRVAGGIDYSAFRGNSSSSSSASSDDTGRRDPGPDDPSAEVIKKLKSNPELWAAVKAEMMMMVPSPSTSTQQHQSQEVKETVANGYPRTSETVEEKAEPTTTTKRRKSWSLLFLRTALPFFGFGVCDNLIMIGAGQQIDQHFGVVMGFSTMIAAGLGQAVSDGSGVTIQQMIERNEHRLGIPDHGFSEEELSGRGGENNDTTNFGWILQLFRTIGIVVGCLIGLIPVIIFDAGNEPRLYEQILSQLPDDKRKRISAQATTVMLKEGDFICKHGGEIDAIYYITRGEVAVIGRDDNNEEIEICQQKCGVVVGYLELVFNHKIVADVKVTSSKLEAKKIPRAIFEAEVGPAGSSGREWLLEEVKNYVKNEPDLVAYRMRHPDFFK